MTYLPTFLPYLPSSVLDMQASLYDLIYLHLFSNTLWGGANVYRPPPPRFWVSEQNLCYFFNTICPLSLSWGVCSKWRVGGVEGVVEERVGGGVHINPSFLAPPVTVFDLPSYLPTFLPTNLPTYLPTFLP